MIAAVSALVAWAILASAGIAHLRDLPSFQRALLAQRTWPAPLTMPLATSVALLEAGVGTAGMVSVAFWDAAALQGWLLMAAAVLYLSYATYGLYLLRRRPGVPCACSHDSNPINLGAVARAAVLACLAGSALFHVPVAQGLSGLEVVVVVLTTSAYAITLWSLPAALQNPRATVAAGQDERVVG